MESLEEIHKAINERLAHLVKAATNKDLEGMISIFADDAVMFAANGESRGREAIYERYSLALPSIVSLGINSLMVYRHGNAICEMGTNVVTRLNEDGEKTIKGNYTTLWEKIDGEWYIKVDFLPPQP
ncbi:MAG: nuclear transport factor 2 family protein [Candidatus Heimdallarchaeota archaeon]|nr:nuclear transport factor 2 family protein [Candidatus Heimdallarchaeota archaeon]